MAGPSGIASYSPTPATNATASGGNSNWAENQPPSSVNNSVRQDHADLRTAFNDLIWFSYGSGDQAPGVTFLGVPYVYVAANQVTVAGVDVTIPHHIGRRMKFVGALTGTVYGTISAVAFGGGNTLITLTMDAAAVLQNEAFNGFLCQVPVTGAPIPTAALAPGAITVTVADITNNQNANTQLGIHNNSAGVSATTAVTLDNGTHQGVFYLLGTGYTSAGMNLADGTAVVGKGAGGLSLVSALNQPVYIGVNSGEVARFTLAGLGIGMVPVNILDITQSNAGAALIAIKNPNAGASAIAGMNITTGTTGGFLYQTGASYAVNGAHRPDATVLRSDSPGGLTLLTMVNQPIYIAPNNVEAARFTSVGLGIIGSPGAPAFNPTYPLDIQASVNSSLVMRIANPNGGSVATSSIVLDNTAYQFNIFMTGQSYTTNAYIVANQAYMVSTGSGGLVFGSSHGSGIIKFVTANTYQAVMDNSGNLQMGYTATFNIAKLFVANNATSLITCRFDTQTVGANNIQTYQPGTTDQYCQLFSNGNGAVGGIHTAGSNTAYATASDIRLKKNITDAGDAGMLIDAIRVRAFDFAVDDQHIDFSFVAQELHAIVPHAVMKGSDVGPEGPSRLQFEIPEGYNIDPMPFPEPFTPWMTDYSRLVPLLVKELQSLRKRVASIEGRTIH